MKTTGPLAADNQAESDNNSRVGVLLGLAAYLMWGSFPIFFKALEGAAPLEIVCHRIFWSVIFLLILVACRRQLGQVLNTLQNRLPLLPL